MDFWNFAIHFAIQGCLIDLIPSCYDTIWFNDSFVYLGKVAIEQQHEL